MTDSRLRAVIADYARRLHARGWVANHDGNLSARLGSDSRGARFLVTPTATSKAEVTADSLLIVDENGRALSQNGKPFSEIGIHLAIYAARPDVGAVVHAHPPTATGFAVAGVSLEEPILPEAVVSLGASIPTVPFSPPGEAAARAIAPYAESHDAVLVANHGVFAWGSDVEQAFLRLELVEHLARISLVARQLGGARAIPGAAIPALLESRRKAGFARSSTTTTPAEKVGEKSGDLSAIIREEIAAALKKR